MSQQSSEVGFVEALQAAAMVALYRGEAPQALAARLNAWNVYGRATGLAKNVLIDAIVSGQEAPGDGHVS